MRPEPNNEIDLLLRGRSELLRFLHHLVRMPDARLRLDAELGGTAHLVVGQLVLLAAHHDLVPADLRLAFG